MASENKTVEGGCEGPKCKLCKQVGPNYTCQSKYVVYLISSFWKKYVGKTTQTLSVRMSKHRFAIQRKKGDGKKFTDHFTDHDFEKAKITILDSATNKHDLYQKERHWIAQHNSYKNGLNSTK